MIMLRRRLVSVVLTMAIVGLSACSKPPQAVIDQAQTALAEAGGAEAATYAEPEWEAAQVAMNSAMAEVEAQNVKFALIRSYKRAEELLAAAQQAAEVAGQAAVTNKEEMRRQVGAAIAAIESELIEAGGHLEALENCRRRPKGFAADLELLRGNVDGLLSDLDGVETAAESERYFEANTMAQGLQSQVDAVVADLQSARSKLGC
jgi:hypothetical protein